MNNLLKKIPNVNYLITEVKKKYSIDNDIILKRSIDECLMELRNLIRNDMINEVSLTKLYSDIYHTFLKLGQTNHRLVINGSGTILHTNLGRANLNEVLLANIDILNSYNNLEYDLNSFKRGSRYQLVEDVICSVVGCESALVVNNNAAAVLLVLNEFAYKKEVIVSASELVEIGGSFRIPEIIKLAQAKLVTVGTTNKQYVKDYVNAITVNTGLITKIHQSNFYIEGFVKSVTALDLCEYRSQNNLDYIIYEDLASGALIDLSKHGIDYEPTIIDSIKSGVDIVSISGDKLLGSVQAGIICGKKEYIDRLKKNQLLRTIRPSGLILNIIEQTFRLYQNDASVIDNIPTLKMIIEKKEDVFLKARTIASLLNCDVEIVETKALIGGGCMPRTSIDSYGLKFCYNILNFKSFLLNQEVPIIGYIEDDCLILDIKTIYERDFQYISEIINSFSS